VHPDIDEPVLAATVLVAVDDTLADAVAVAPPPAPPDPELLVAAVLATSPNRSPELHAPTARQLQTSANVQLRRLMRCSPQPPKRHAARCLPRERKPIS
jgi:hypothetical protein